MGPRATVIVMGTRASQPDKPNADDPLNLAGLRCTACGYNLTGLTRCRCPECGREFEPAGVRAYWEMKSRTAPARVVALCMISCALACLALILLLARPSPPTPGGLIVVAVVLGSVSIVAGFRVLWHYRGKPLTSVPLAYRMAYAVAVLLTLFTLLAWLYDRRYLGKDGFEVGFFFSATWLLIAPFYLWFRQPGEWTPPILDAVLAAVGCTLVRGLNDSRLVRRLLYPSNAVEYVLLLALACHVAGEISWRLGGRRFWGYLVVLVAFYLPPTLK